MTEQKIEEKCDFVKMHLNTLITFTITGESNHQYHGIGQNLNATGLYMTTQKTPAIGSRIELVINSRNQRLPPYYC